MKKVFCFLLGKILFSTPIDLKIGVRPQGIGGVFVSISDDANALQWNRVGFSQITWAEVSFMDFSPFKAESTYIDYLSFTHSFLSERRYGLPATHRFGLGVRF